MTTVRLRDLTVGRHPAFVATVLADTLDGMLQGVSNAHSAGADCVELRVDRLASAAHVADLVRRVNGPHIVACRSPSFGGFFSGSEAERVDRLQAAAEAGAACVDIEFLAVTTIRDRFLRAAKDMGVPVLVGYEDMEGTPPRHVLLDAVREIAQLSPDLLKLAVRATSHRDLLTVLSLVPEMLESAGAPFAAIALGPYGAASRPLACLLGASFTYCAVERGAAPGQLTVAEVRSVVDVLSEQRWTCSSS